MVLDHDELSPGYKIYLNIYRELASFIIYAGQLTSSSSNISESFAKIISATGAFEGVLEMLKYENLVKEYPDAIEHIKVSGSISFKNVYFQYPNSSV